MKRERDMKDTTHPAIKILLVDDEPFILTAVAQLLRGAGHSVLVCEQWAGVASLVRHQEPDLILLDYNMPVLKGGELCAILKRSAVNPRMRIVLFSSEPEEFLQGVVEACGADGYIRKGVAGPVLLAEIRNALLSAV